MGRGVPLLGVQLVVLFDLIADGLGVVIRDVLVDDLDVVLGEELLDVRHPLARLQLALHKSNQITYLINNPLIQRLSYCHRQ